MIEKEIHPVQARILTALLFRPAARFSELNLTGLTNDHFSFHIRKLVEAGMVEKNEDGYQLTAKGKEFANRLDTETAKVERQPKTTVLVIGARGGDGEREYLVQQRLKQPYYGYHGFISGKVRWGEKIGETVRRELTEESGLIGMPKLLGVEHKIDVKEGVVLEDKYFYIYLVENPSGELLVDFEGGKNLWLTEAKIVKLDKLFGDMVDLLNFVKDGREFGFLEKVFEIGEY